MPLPNSNESTPPASLPPEIPAPRRKRRFWLALAGVSVLAVIGVVAWSVWGPDPLDEIHAAIDRRDFDTANDLLSKYLAENENDNEARLLAVRTARRAGDFARASDHITSYSKRNRPNPEFDREVAMLSAQQGSREEAERLYAEYIAQPESPEAPFAMEAYLEGTLNALAAGPDNVIDPEACEHTAVSMLHAAADLWLRSRPARADQIQGRVWKGRIFRYSREQAKSREALREALALDPNHFQARFHLALQLQHDAPEEALMHLELLSKRRPDDRKLLFVLATTHRMLVHGAEARRILDAILKSDPQDLSALVELGQLNLDEGKLADAEPLLRRAHELAPNTWQTNIAMSRCRQLSGKPDEAAKYRRRFDEIVEAGRKGFAAKTPC